MAESHYSPETEAGLNWFEEWFNHPLYLEVYSHRNQAEAAHCINTILSISGCNLKDPSSVSVLDIACGAGRHALELAKRGYQVTGNDLSPFLLEEAKKSAEELQVPLNLTCCDMRHLQAENTYDLVVQLFTSFGYFKEKKDDLGVLNKAWKALNDSGWYVLDLINPGHLIRNLVSSSRRTAGELTIQEDRILHDDTITKTIAITSPEGETLAFKESVRLYSAEEMIALLQQTGFAVQKTIGNYAGEPFSSNDSPRMIIFSRKKVSSE